MSWGWGGVFGTGGSMGLEGGFRGAELSSRWRVPSGWGGPWGRGGHWDSGGVHLVWDWRVRGAGGISAAGGSVGPGASLRLGGPWGRGHPWDSGVPGSEGVFTHPPPYVQDLGNAATPPGATQPSVPQFPLRRCTRRTAEPPRDPSPPTGGGNPRWGRPRETAAPLPMGRIRAAGTARPRYAAEGPLHW